MLDLDYLKKLAVQKQTGELNIIREYCQNLFLSSFYNKTNSSEFLFKGGTALRIIFHSPRYSEDLDFSANNIDSIEDILIDVFHDLDKEGIKVNNMPTSQKTTGGYISIFDFQMPFNFYNPQIKINIQVKSEQLKAQSNIVEHDYGFSYSIIHLDEALLINEKITAFRNRIKARDFFDLLFILRSDHLRSLLSLDNTLKVAILAQLDTISDGDLKADLVNLLPRNFQNVFSAGGLKENIRRTVNLYFT
jgi:predicted nucleotidyltransferase component of viral defense system